MWRTISTCTFLRFPESMIYLYTLLQSLQSVTFVTNIIVGILNYIRCRIANYTSNICKHFYLPESLPQYHLCSIHKRLDPQSVFFSLHARAPPVSAPRALSLTVTVSDLTLPVQCQLISTQAWRIQRRRSLPH